MLGINELVRLIKKGGYEAVCILNPHGGDTYTIRKVRRRGQNWLDIFKNQHIISSKTFSFLRKRAVVREKVRTKNRVIFSIESVQEKPPSRREGKITNFCL